jgi:hypothetical protein
MSCHLQFRPQGAWRTLDPNTNSLEPADRPRITAFKVIALPNNVGIHVRTMIPETLEIINEK